MSASKGVAVLRIAALRRNNLGLDSKGAELLRLAHRDNPKNSVRRK